MDSSLAQWLMSRRLKTSIPVMNKLLEPVWVTEKLAAQEPACQVTLQPVHTGPARAGGSETVRMKSLPGDNTLLCRAGTCLGKVAQRSYLVDVDGSIF